jgi:hypothetical protein
MLARGREKPTRALTGRFPPGNRNWPNRSSKTRTTSIFSRQARMPRSGILNGDCLTIFGISEYRTTAALPDLLTGNLSTVEELEAELQKSDEPPLSLE